jgi:hypothetical protein
MSSWTREDRENKSPIYWYSSPPGAITLEGIQVKQKGRTFYIIASPASQLDRLCSVPLIPYESSNAQVATDATTAFVSRWQREMDGERCKDIASFFADPGNFIVNTALIGLPRTATFFASSGLRSNCTIQVNWIKRQCPNCQWLPPAGHPHHGQFFDACPKCSWDGRPCHIIDGQHRIRGCAAAPPPSCDENLVASVLVEDQFAQSDEAKIFTEITTSAIDLDPLHKVYLLYKFGLRALAVRKLRDADFRKTTPEPGKLNSLGLRNRRAYEIVCDLVTDPGSRWSDRVSMFPGPPMHPRRGDVIDADTLVWFLERWLAEDGPLANPQKPDGMASKSEAADALRAYLESCLATWPAGVGTPPGTSSTFWYDGRGKPGPGKFQLRGIFEVFLYLFETTTRRILTHGGSLSRSSYDEELRYVETIDWDDDCWYGLSAPDVHKEILRGVLDHLYSQAPAQVGASRVPIKVNDWMKERPDSISITAQLAANAPFATVTETSPLTFAWASSSPFSNGPIPKPVNARREATILLEQEQSDGRIAVLDKFETKTSKCTIEEPPPGMDSSPSAAPIRISITYTNRNGSTTFSFEHRAV